MNKRSLIDQLNDAIEARVFRRGAAQAEERLEMLVRIGLDLQTLAREQFKDNLKAELRGKETNMSATATPTKGVRKGFHTVTPYLIVADAPAVVEFVKRTFGGEETFRTFGSAGGYHCEVRVRDSMLMIGGGGEGSSWKGDPMPTSLHVYVPKVDEVYRRALDVGAVSLYEPMDQPYGDRDCGVRDPGGNQWFIATDIGGHNQQGLRALTSCFMPKNAPKFLEFLEHGLGATVVQKHEAPEGTIVHAKAQIGDSIVEFSEAHGQWQPMPTATYLYVDDADALFHRTLDAGAKVVYPLADQPYGDRNGGVIDEWGNHWYIGSHLGETK